MCEFCENFDFSSASYKTDRHESNILLAVGSCQFPIHRQFNFCPCCGATRTEVLQKRSNNNKVKGLYYD